MTGEVERLKAEEAQASLEKKRAAEALMQEVYRSNAEQVLTCIAPWPCECLIAPVGSITRFMSLISMGSRLLLQASWL